MVNSLRQVAKWILRNTIESKQSLTPELALRLITESSPLWKAGPEMCPFSDPYWAFYWPGGQAVTRYILDYSRLFSNANVLDFGCGCGSASIAASRAGANVMANDIDPNALVSTLINYRKNGVSTQHTQFISENLLDPCQETSLKQFLKAKTSFIILGDMFYDVDFAEKLFCWLKRIKETTTVRILVGDPHRHPLAEEQLERYTVKVQKQLLAEYQLPQCVRREHYGFNTGSVYELQQFIST
ncbi:Electron transfer flavoprotein subunit beta lysine methyltransferase [Trichostrongylus colubriformis]|uniref:ETFB lysine methyltransferase n=1 Tax=Trichostrongylus colubriformis TaxID=6319 RepID=A0AAN8INU7_TRICO